jgi:hypothetical protein
MTTIEPGAAGCEASNVWSAFQNVILQTVSRLWWEGVQASKKTSWSPHDYVAAKYEAAKKHQKHFLHVFVSLMNPQENNFFDIKLEKSKAGQKISIFI